MAEASALHAAATVDGAPSPHAHASQCQNCGHSLTGAYCSSCGQASHVHRSLGHFLEELLHGVVHFDSKAWRTLPRLFVRPGTMTREYIMGRRAHHVSPLAIFLFTVFATFLVFAVLPPLQVQTGTDRGPRVELEVQADGAGAGADTTERRVGEALEARAAANGGTVPVDEAIGIVVRETADEVYFINDAMTKKLRAKLQNPDLLAYKLQNSAYKFSFLLVPLSLPFLWVMFAWKRGVTLYDHAVFALYSISLVTMVFVAVMLLGRIGHVVADWVALGLVAAIPVHMFFHLKGTYALGWFSASWRAFVLVTMVVWFVAALFITAIFMMGVLG